MPNALVPIANGAEEMEAVIILDVLRRAEWTVVAAGLHDGPVTASRGVRILPDVGWDDVDADTFDWIILPGGLPGTEAMMADERVRDALQRHVQMGRKLGAICAAPLVLQASNLLEGRVFTSHPSVADRFAQGTRVDERVVVDGDLVTSQGPGTAMEFVLAIIELVEGQEKARMLAHAMVCPSGAGT